MNEDFQLEELDNAGEQAERPAATDNKARNTAFAGAQKASPLSWLNVPLRFHLLNECSAVATRESPEYIIPLATKLKHYGNALLNFIHERRLWRAFIIEIDIKWTNYFWLNLRWLLLRNVDWGCWSLNKEPGHEWSNHCTRLSIQSMFDDMNY